MDVLYGRSIGLSQDFSHVCYRSRTCRMCRSEDWLLSLSVLSIYTPPRHATFDRQTDLPYEPIAATTFLPASSIMLEVATPSCLHFHSDSGFRGIRLRLVMVPLQHGS
eukprot:scaffold17675_cov70-Cylindrotheca_fusiformis.AAC.2